MLFKTMQPKLGKLFPAGTTVFREGDVATDLHMIQSGLVEVYRTGFDGSRIRLALLKAGDMFGTRALFDQEPFHASIQTLEETWILLIDKKAIMRRIYEDPSLVLRIMENLSSRIRRQDDEILALTNDYHAAIGGLGSLADATLMQEQRQASVDVAQLVGETCRILHERQRFPETLDATFVANMKMACLLYDIGSSGLPDGLLSKRTPLEKKEQELLKTHIQIGSSVLRKAAARTKGSHFLLAAELAQYHHERFDGTGYLGLRAGAIPVSARIIAVIDVYVALLADRPYRTALSPEEALAFIATGAGTQFDPQVTEAFATVVRQRVRVTR